MSEPIHKRLIGEVIEFKSEAVGATGLGGEPAYPEKGIRALVKSITILRRPTDELWSITVDYRPFEDHNRQLETERLQGNPDDGFESEKKYTVRDILGDVEKEDFWIEAWNTTRGRRWANLFEPIDKSKFKDIFDVTKLSQVDQNKALETEKTVSNDSVESAVPRGGIDINKIVKNSSELSECVKLIRKQISLAIDERRARMPNGEMDQKRAEEEISFLENLSSTLNALSVKVQDVSETPTKDESESVRIMIEDFCQKFKSWVKDYVTKDRVYFIADIGLIAMVFGFLTSTLIGIPPTFAAGIIIAKIGGTELYNAIANINKN